MPLAYTSNPHLSGFNAIKSWCFCWSLCLFILLTSSGCSNIQIFPIEGDVNRDEYGYAEHIALKIEIIGASRYPDFQNLIITATSLDIEIEISNGGRLIQTHILRSSNNPAIDAAMLDIIRYSAPYPPFPDEMKMDALKIQKRWQFMPE